MLPMGGKLTGADLMSMNLDNFSTSNLRSEEQLKKYTIDESIENKPLEKALLLLDTGDEIQKISVINSLLELYKFDSAGCIQKVVPRIQQNLSGSSTEYQLSYCASIRCLHEARIIPVDNFSSVFLPTILMGMDHRDSQMMDNWVDCLVNLIPTLPITTLLKQIQPVAITKASPAQPVHTRAVSSLIIGALCKKLPGPEVDKELIPVIVPLWRDPSPEVRSSMMRQLPFIVRAVHFISETEYIIRPFMQLVSDELPKVADVAFAAMVESLPFFNVDTLRGSIWPLLREIITQAFENDHNLLLVVTEQYAKMVVGLERAIPSSEKEIYIKHYISLLERVSEKASKVGRNRMGSELCGVCRRHCADNYKDMAKFSYNENSRTLLDKLHVALGDMISDSFWECRKTIAASMFDIVQIYGKYSYLLMKELNQILNDNLVEVIEGIIPHLAEILVTYVKGGYFGKDMVEYQSSELLKALEQCENTLFEGYKWRVYCKYINQLEIMWFIFSPDIVCNKFIDLFFKRLDTCKVLQTKLALLRAILVNLKYIPRPLYKSEAKCRILDFSTSPNFYDRGIFIRMFDILVDIHSTIFIKDNYFIRYLQMSGDKVPNIRWSVCELLPKLHATLKLPEDIYLMKLFEEVVQQLNNDEDSEIQEIMQRIKTEIDTSTNQNFFPQDKTKFEEEIQLQNLTTKQAQSFPESIKSIFGPTVMGIDDHSTLKLHIMNRKNLPASGHKPASNLAFWPLLSRRPQSFVRPNLCSGPNWKKYLPTFLGKQDHQPISSRATTSSDEGTGRENPRSC